MMTRRTITLPEELAAEIDAAVAAGAARNVSRFLQQAARNELTELHRERLTREATKLDPNAEVALARDQARGRPRWGRLR